MKTLLSSEMRELDRRTIEDVGIPGIILMDRAGRATADIVMRLLSLRNNYVMRVQLIAGCGNNGGDAFVAAKYLAMRGVDVELWIAGSRSKLFGDALISFEDMTSAGVEAHFEESEEGWDSRPREPTYGHLILVDGVLGTGARGAPRGAVAGAVRFIRDMGKRNQVVAIDIPSGLDADTGIAEGDAVRADVTITMAFPKRGMLTSGAIEYTGSVLVADIGIPQSLADHMESDPMAITAIDVSSILGMRARESHKGNYGHVLVMGGAGGFAGAVAMAARGALLAGAGLVTAVVPESVAVSVSAMVPEVMVHGVAETEENSLSSDLISSWTKRITDADVCLLGPGMTTHDETRKLVKRVLVMRKHLTVLDADALNVCAGLGRQIIRRASCPVVITPHPGEMGRILGRSTADIQTDRLAIAREAVEVTGAVVVLKGAGTIVASSERGLHVNMTGNPGMATGGMGDVLGGLVSGIGAQGIAGFEASCVSVYVHGYAGDLAAWRGSQVSVTATDVLRELPVAFRDILGR